MTLALFAIANSPRPQRRDSEVFQANASQELFGTRALAWADTRARKTILKRTHAQNALQENALVGDFMIGTPHPGGRPQNLELNIDTNFPYVLIPSKDMNHRSHYDPHLSTSSNRTDYPFLFSLLGVAGTIYLDVLRIADTDFQDMDMAYATIHVGRGAHHANGIFGLSFTDVSGGLPSFNRAARGKLVMNQFAFRLSSLHYELHLGGIEPGLIDGEVEYHKLDHGHDRPGPWPIGGGTLFINRHRFEGSFRTILDSTVGYIAGDRHVVDTIYKAIFPEHQDGNNSFPCDRAPEVSFRWKSGEIWTISREDFIYPDPDNYALHGKHEMCKGILRAKSAQDVGGAWIVGHVFMKHRYTVFDRTLGVGIGKLKEP